MSIRPKLSCDQLHLELLTMGYNVPQMVLELRTVNDRALTEQWMKYSRRINKCHGQARKRPSWLGTWFVGER